MAAPRNPEKRRYRKVLCRMYADDKFLQLSRPQPNGQSLWTYLITGPHTTSVPGLFLAGEAQLAEALQWPLKGFRGAWSEIEQLGMARSDWKARVVWLPKAIRYNPPENPNVVKGWQSSVDEVPHCALKAEALAHIAVLLKGLGEGFLKPFVKGFGEALLCSTSVGLANQEQEQEQEQEKEKRPSLSPPAVGTLSPKKPDPFTDATVTDRAGRFIERYTDLYVKHRNAQYLVRPQRDYAAAVPLCQTWVDDARLDKIATIFLTTDHQFAESGSRTIPQFAGLASWCDSQLAAWEAKQRTA